MDSQTQAILNFLMGGNPNSGDSSSAMYGLSGSGQGNQGSGVDGGAGQLPSISGFSPINSNPNYANTVKGFFEYNPVAGPRPFTSTPLKPGNAGQNSSRGSSGWSSFLGNDPNSIMRTLSGGQ